MKGRILIIDDEPRWIDFAKHDLNNFEIVVARDLETVMVELEADQFDLVIASSRRLDILETIRKWFAKWPVVIMTVQPTTQEALTVYRLGAIRYFPKSFGRRDLLNRVKEVIPVSTNAGQSWQRREGDPKYDPRTIQNPGGG
jgi:DNA-binding response OmpR family regulator